MQSLRAFEVKYLQPTDTKPTRILVEDMRYGQKWTLYPSKSKMSLTWEIVVDLLFSKHNIKILAQAEYGDSILLLTDNFDDLTDD
jgi:hypothetical protein